MTQTLTQSMTPAAQMPAQLRACATLDLSALSHNIAQARRALPPHVQLISIVKGNAYGHGLARVVPALISSGVRHFGVATLSEARELRALTSTATIFLLSPLFPFEVSDALALNVVPMVSSFQEFEMLQAAAQQAGIRWSVQLKVDTGMARAGVWHTQALPLAHQICASAHLQLLGIFTHLAAGADALFTAQQRLIFHDLLRQLPSLPAFVHADASDGFETFPQGGDNLCNAVRLGRLQYGLAPFNPLLKSRVSLRPVLSLRARVALVKDVPAGTTVGYRRTHTCLTPTRIAVVAAGYLDGIPTHLSNRAHLLVHGQRAPIIGRVTMDMTMLDITELSHNIASGDVVTIIGTDGGETISLNDLAHLTQQPAWELLSGITARVPRVVWDGSL